MKRDIGNTARRKGSCERSRDTTLQVAATTAQLAALQDERELQAGVASDLERILARIEHASAGPARGGTSKSAVAGGSLAAVSKQLVQAKLAEADAQRKLRVSLLECGASQLAVVVWLLRSLALV